MLISRNPQVISGQYRDMFHHIPLRILLVDDFGSFRQALRRQFNSLTDLSVIGEAADGRSAIEMALYHVPHVIIMDVRMPCLGGVEATRRIKRVLPSVHVIGVSSDEDPVTQEAMKAAGCSAFVPKDCAHTLPHVIAQITGRPITDQNFC